MNISKKRFLSLIAVVIAVSMISGMMLNSQIAPTKVSVSTKLMFYDTPSAVVRNAAGQVLYNATGETDPLTSTGSSYIISMIANTSVSTKAVYLCLSNDTTPLVTWTALPTLITANGLAITTALTPTYGVCTTASGLSTYMMLNYTFVCSTANENAVGCMGVCYVAAGTSGLVCAGTFSPLCNLAPTDSIDCQYNITMPCG